MQAKRNALLTKEIPKLRVEAVPNGRIARVALVPEQIHAEDGLPIARAQPEAARVRRVELRRIIAGRFEASLFETFFEELHHLFGPRKRNPDLRKLRTEQNVVGAVVHRQASPRVVLKWGRLTTLR